MAKTEIEECRRIEVWWLLRDIKKKGGYKNTNISWTNGGNINVVVNLIEPNSYAQFIYAVTPYGGEKKSIDYKSQLVTTNCNLGGKRYWFICPLVKQGVSCRKRVGVLYMDGDYFGCRDCYELTYASRNKKRGGMFGYLTDTFDAEDKLKKIYEKKFNRFYRGKPTKTQQRIDRADSKKMFAYRDFRLIDKGILKSRVK
jgi:hypothetical protein